MSTFLTILGLVAITLAQTYGDTCKPVSEDEVVTSLPDFIAKEFTVDVEVASSDVPDVFQMMMYYSQPKNQVRLNILEKGEKADQFIYFTDQEFLNIEYDATRGYCVASNISEGVRSFLVGPPKDGSKVQGPLGVLRMTGKSGFRNDEIKVKKVQTTMIRGISVDEYQSCQMWTYNDAMYTVKVRHYFSNSAWHHPSGSVIPVALILEGSGHGKSFTHTYSFFNVQFNVDPVKLETPPGVFCKRERGYPFPALPQSIKFSGEVIDKESGFLTYIEEIFSVRDQIAVMRIQPQSLIGTDRQMMTIEVLQDFQTGLAFVLNKYESSCGAVLNITDSNTQIPVPFSREHNGKVRQLTMEEFFYVTNVGYHYVGVRNVRNVPCDTYVTRAPLLTDQSKTVTVEWYFARSRPDDKLPRIPMKTRVWYDDYTTTSKDMNIYDVDFTRVDLHKFDVRTCFPETDLNHFQCVLEGASIKSININSEILKENTRRILAQQAGIIFWRLVDLEFYFTDKGLVMEFAILNAPPYAGDVEGPPYQHLSLQDASNNLKTAVKEGFPIQVINPVTKEEINLTIKDFIEL